MNCALIQRMPPQREYSARYPLTPLRATRTAKIHNNARAA
jgi:hypothetical protein